jgi:PEP-CTERM motif
MNSRLFNKVLRGRSAAFAALAMSAMIVSAHADPVIDNGNFSQISTNSSSQFGTGFPSQTVTGWTTSGYNFVFLPGTATTGANGGLGTVALYAPADSSPAGGNFLALDGDPGFSGAVSQTISGLTPGQATTISFLYAGAQQTGFSGASQQTLDVSLGGQTLDTTTLSVASEGFSGWEEANLTFDPTSTSEVLSFLAVGTPSGVPPFTLLSDVSISTASPVPEPGSLALLSTGLIGLSGFVRSRFKKTA